LALFVLLSTLLLAQAGTGGQPGVDAGPAIAACFGQSVTLTATPYGFAPPLPDFTLLWQGAPEPYQHMVATPATTSVFWVSLIADGQLYQDSVTVLVHPGNPDLDENGLLDDGDWFLWFANWALPPDSQGAFDPDGDGRTTVLDWFFFAILPEIRSTPRLLLA
jgi:hypothetical protein